MACRTAGSSWTRQSQCDRSHAGAGTWRPHRRATPPQTPTPPADGGAPRLRRSRSTPCRAGGKRLAAARAGTAAAPPRAPAYRRLTGRPALPRRPPSRWAPPAAQRRPSCLRRIRGASRARLTKRRAGQFRARARAGRGCAAAARSSARTGAGTRACCGASARRRPCTLAQGRSEQGLRTAARLGTAGPGSRLATPPPADAATDPSATDPCTKSGGGAAASARRSADASRRRQQRLRAATRLDAAGKTKRCRPVAAADPPRPRAATAPAAGTAFRAQIRRSAPPGLSFAPTRADPQQGFMPPPGRMPPDGDKSGRVAPRRCGAGGDTADAVRGGSRSP